MKKQTAVEWLKKEVEEYGDREYLIIRWTDLDELINQAKQMEKEQHQETFKQSRQAKIFEEGMPPVWESFDEYYNETYGPLENKAQ